MAQVVGIITATWGGRDIPCEKGATVKLGGIKNNPTVYGRRVDRAQEMIASEIKITTNLRRGERMSDLYTQDEAELQMQLDTGQGYIFKDAFLTDKPTITGGEGGKIELNFQASEGQEILN